MQLIAGVELEHEKTGGEAVCSLSGYNEEKKKTADPNVKFLA